MDYTGATSANSTVQFTLNAGNLKIKKLQVQRLLIFEEQAQPCIVYSVHHAPKLPCVAAHAPVQCPMQHSPTALRQFHP